MTVTGVNPGTRVVVGTVDSSTEEELLDRLSEPSSAADVWAESTISWRAGALYAVADALDADAAELVAIGSFE